MYDSFAISVKDLIYKILRESETKLIFVIIMFCSDPDIRICRPHTPQSLHMGIVVFRKTSSIILGKDIGSAIKNDNCVCYIYNVMLHLTMCITRKGPKNENKLEEFRAVLK